VPKIPASERDAFYEARRAELARVALKLWAERGFDKTSVAEIAREAGVAKGTFYLYFETKQSLLLEVLRRNSLVPNVLQLIDDLQHASLEVAVGGFVRGAWRHLSDNRDLILVVLRELPSHLDEAHDAIERVVLPSNEALAGYLESHISPERAAALSTVISVRALVGMVLVVFISQELLGAGRLMPIAEDDITHTIAELFLRGVAPETRSASRGEAGPSTSSPPAVAGAASTAHESAHGDDP
jgi:AcrR family transcriptional regulator